MSGSEQEIPKKGARKGQRRQPPWRRDPAILARLPDVERRHLAGLPNTAIAVALGVDEGTIRNDLKRIQELWQERAGAAVVELRAEKVAELADIKYRAVAAAEFDELCERAVLFGITFTDPDGRVHTVRRDEKGSAMFRGNKAAALGQARQAIMDQAKILGLIVEKVAPTTPDGAGLDLAALMALAREGGGDGPAPA